MFTEKFLRRHPGLVQALTGLCAEEFWRLVLQIAERAPEYERARHDRPDRVRALGAGRPFELPIAVRVAMLLTYLRLHIPQATVAILFGTAQADVSRELRRLLPLLKEVLPVPEVWEVAEEGQPLSEEEMLGNGGLADGRALIDATEQEIERSQDSVERKEHYSGKQKAFTLKTQIVTDGEHHIKAISEAVPGKVHDKKLSDEVQTVERLPDGCEADADKGYQGMAAGVERVQVQDAETGETKEVPRVAVKTPFKKPPKGELTEEQKAFNQALASVRVRVEHCIGWAKNWAILATRFRCAHSVYTPIMQVVCGLVNRQTARWQARQAHAPIAAASLTA